MGALFYVSAFLENYDPGKKTSDKNVENLSSANITLTNKILSTSINSYFEFTNYK